MSKNKKVVAALPQVPQDSAVFAQDLTFVYNEKSAFKTVALNNISLDIKRGEFVAVVGHTGSGKTTFVQHLNALIRIQNGNLFVLGRNLAEKKPDLKALRKEVGMVFQYPEYQLFADTVLDDVCFGPKNFGMQKEEREQAAKEALETVGMDFDKVKNKSPFDLSGGEKRRVALAGVLVTKPKLLVMDEPTAGLDPQGKQEILSLVKRLNKEQGTTVVMVSHDMNEVYENADRVIVFRCGEICYDLPPRQLFKAEEEIEQMNLEVPSMARFCNELERNGYVLDENAKTVDEVFAACKKLFGGDGYVS